MEITFRCAHCGCELSFRELGQDRSPCARCGQEIVLHLTPRMREENVVDQCAVCGLDKLYEQKDFNRTFGVALFLAAAVACVILCWKNEVFWGYTVLLGAAAVDYLLYRCLPNVVICYRCQAQHRRYSPRTSVPPFELGLLEKYNPLDKRSGADNPAAQWKER